MRDGKTLLVANPAAQHGNGMKSAQVAYDLLVEWLGDDALDCVYTTHSGHAVDIASLAPSGGYSTVIAVGGDGLVHEVVNGLMRLPRDRRPAFGLVPAGSGNDYARTLGMSECIPDAIVQFLDARKRALDVGCCNGEHFAETLSFGLDAAIALDTVKRRERTGQQGTMLYLSSGIDQLLHHLDTYRFEALIDGERKLEASMLMLAMQVGQTYGGGFRICPEADPSDGMLDICYATAPMSVIEATYKFLRAKNAHHTRFKNVLFDRASTIDLKFDRRPPCQIDGEEHVADSYRISIERGALDVLVASKPA